MRRTLRRRRCHGLGSRWCKGAQPRCVRVASSEMRRKENKRVSRDTPDQTPSPGSRNRCSKSKWIPRNLTASPRACRILGSDWVNAGSPNKVPERNTASRSAGSALALCYACYPSSKDSTGSTGAIHQVGSMMLPVNIPTTALHTGTIVRGVGAVGGSAGLRLRGLQRIIVHFIYERHLFPL